MASKLVSNDLIRCPCTSSRNNLSDFPELKNILPDDYKYTVCNWKKISDDYFESRFRVNATSEDEAKEWFRKFSVLSSTAFNVEPNLLLCEEAYINAFRCRHNTLENLPENKTDPAFKETVCASRLIMILKLSGFSQVHKIRDVHVPDFPMTIIYHQHHNHPVESVDAVRLHLARVYHHPNAHIRNVLKDLCQVEKMLQEKLWVSGELPEAVANSYRYEDKYKPFHDVIKSICSVAEEEDEPGKNDGFLLPPEDDPSTDSTDRSSICS